MFFVFEEKFIPIQNNIVYDFGKYHQLFVLDFGKFGMFRFCKNKLKCHTKFGYYINNV